MKTQADELEKKIDILNNYKVKLNFYKVINKIFIKIYGC